MKPEFTAIVESEQLKVRQLAIKVEITNSATPAAKIIATNLAGVAYLRTEGQTTAADAIENLSGSFSTATDSTGVFGLLLEASKLAPNGLIDVLEVRSFVQSGTLAVSAPVTNFVSSLGNIAIGLDSSLSFAAAPLLATVIVIYRVK